MRRLGYDVAADGPLDGQMIMTVESFQRNAGLFADGMLGTETLSALEATLETPVEAVLGLWARGDDGLSRPEAIATVLGDGLAVTSFSAWKQLEQKRHGVMFWSPGLRNSENPARRLSVSREVFPSFNVAILRPKNMPPVPSPSHVADGAPGDRCTCVDYDEHLRLRVLFGTIEPGPTSDRWRLRIDPREDRPIGAGAPVFVDRTLVGIVASTGSTEVIPGGLIIQGVIPPSPERSPAAPDLDALFHALGRRARNAVERAEAFRVASHATRLDTEHLLVGLTELPSSETADVLQKAGISISRMRKMLAELPDSALPDATMAAADAVALEHLPELSVHVQDALANADRVARENGSRAIGERHLLYGVLAAEKSPVARMLAGAGVRRDLDPQRAWHAHGMPGFRSDRADKKDPDRLDLGREVEALCSVITARDIKPPVSIGLFGDWGTGKTFFMMKMQAWIDRMRADMRGRRPDESAYCTNVVQLWFNAWHFIDANLWASLAAEIFEGLGRAVATDELLDGDPKVREEARATLLAAAASAKDVLAEAERQKALAEAEKQALDEKIKNLQASDKEIARELGGAALAKAAYDVVIRQPGAEEKLKEAATTLKIPELQAGGAEMQKQLLAIAGLFTSVKANWLAFRKNPRLWVRFGLFVAVLLGVTVFAVPPLLTWLKANGVPKTISGLGAAMASLATLLTPYIVKARRALALVQETRKGQGALIDEEKKRREKDLKEEQSKLPERIKAAEEQRAEAEKKINDLERQLADWRADKRMADFLHERRESTDYTQHLGVVARARRDFERLSLLLADSVEQRPEDGAHEPAVASGVAKKAPAASGIPRIDRIVLYIDDLDRCPEDKVVDVLQAVHLLLAFPLFVVVVGVDPRWLLRSLTTYARTLRTDADDELDGMSDEERVHWRSTPLNYLEKIFQIPFALRPMPKTGFENLIVDLVPDVDSPTRRRLEELDRAVEGFADESAESSANAMNEAAATSPAEAPEPGAASPPSSVGAPPVVVVPAALSLSPIDLKPQHLEIPEDERRFIQDLYPLIPTPRAAKRLVNVYRLLRATLDEKDWHEFQGGEYQATLLLLGLLTGYPAEATEILRDLVEDQPRMPWWEFVETRYGTRRLDQTPDAARWRELMSKLDDLKPLIAGERSCAHFVRWAPRVARYSFESGRVSLTRSSERRQRPADKADGASPKHPPAQPALPRV